MTRRSVVITATLGLGLAAGCIGGPGNVGTVWIRNDAPAVVDVEVITTSGGWPFGTTYDQVHPMAVWRAGLCHISGEAIWPGPVTIHVSGGPVTGVQSLSVTEPQPADGSAGLDLTVTIGPTGVVTFGRGTPQEAVDASPCTGPPEVEPSG